MTRRNCSLWMFAAVAGAFSLALASPRAASAFWWGHSRGGSSGSYGSWGSHGSSGSYGSSGSHGSSGSYGSWGSHGSSGSYGSWGSHGSSGGVIYRKHHVVYYNSHGSSGSYGSWGSHGSSGSYGSWGSHGGVYYYDHPPHPPTPAPDADSTEEGEEEVDMTSIGLPQNAAGLLVRIPDDAKVFVNDRETMSTGPRRQFISRGLQPGMQYTFVVRAEFDRDGETVSQSQTVKVATGRRRTVVLGSQEPVAVASNSQVKTTLRLRVPAEAKVFLAGKPTQSQGEEREFSTDNLSAGGTWEDYTVRVELEKDGRKLAEQRTITLSAGESQELTFRFGAESADVVAQSSPEVSR